MGATLEIGIEQLGEYFCIWPMETIECKGLCIKDDVTVHLEFRFDQDVQYRITFNREFGGKSKLHSLDWKSLDDRRLVEDTMVTGPTLLRVISSQGWNKALEAFFGTIFVERCHLVIEYDEGDIWVKMQWGDIVAYIENCTPESLVDHIDLMA